MPIPSTQPLINSVQHPLIKETAALARKKERLEAGEILVETRHPIEEALKAGLTPVRYFFVQDSADLGQAQWPDETTAYPVSEAAMKKMATTDSTPPCLGVFKLPESGWNALTQNQSGLPPLFILADHLQDPGNLGTLIRSALAFNAQGVILTGQSVDVFSPKVIRASAGLVFACPIVQIQADLPIQDALSQPALNQCQVLFTTGHMQWQDKPVLSYREVDYNQATVLVFGNEGQGLPEDSLSAASVASAAIANMIMHAVRIPIHAGVESLNISVSAAVILAEAAFQRGVKQ